MNINISNIKTRKCLYCGKDFLLYLDNNRKTSNQKYCGTFCSNRNNKEIRKKKNIELKALKEIKRNKETNLIIKKTIIKPFSQFIDLTYGKPDTNIITILKFQHFNISIKNSDKKFQNNQYINFNELNELKREAKIIKELYLEEKDEKMVQSSNLPLKILKNYKGTKPENLFKEYLLFNKLEQGEDFFYQYKVFNYRVDFYFPKINLGIEIDGDYWHANPKKYNEDKIMPYPNGSMIAKEVWARDKLREEKLKEEIKLIRFWESDVLTKTFETETYSILESLNY